MSKRHILNTAVGLGLLAGGAAEFAGGPVAGAAEAAPLVTTFGPPVQTETSSMVEARTEPIDVMTGRINYTLDEEAKNGGGELTKKVDELRAKLTTDEGKEDLWTTYSTRKAELDARKEITGANTPVEAQDELIDDIDGYNQGAILLTIANGGSAEFRFMDAQQRAEFAGKKAAAEVAFQLELKSASKRGDDQKRERINEVNDKFATLIGTGFSNDVDTELAAIQAEILETIDSVSDFTNQEAVAEANIWLDQQTLRVADILIANPIIETIELTNAGTYDIGDDGVKVPRIAEIAGQRTPDELRYHVFTDYSTGSTCNRLTGETSTGDMVVEFTPRRDLENNPVHTNVTAVVFGVNPDGTRVAITAAEVSSQDGKIIVPSETAGLYTEIYTIWIEQDDALHNEIGTLGELATAKDEGGNPVYSYTDPITGEDRLFGEGDIYSPDTLNSIQGIFDKLKEKAELSDDEMQVLGKWLPEFKSDFTGAIGLYNEFITRQQSGEKLTELDISLMAKIHSMYNFIDDIGEEQAPLAIIDCSPTNFTVELMPYTVKRDEPTPDYTQVIIGFTDFEYTHSTPGKHGNPGTPVKPPVGPPELPPTGSDTHELIYIAVGLISLGAAVLALPTVMEKYRRPLTAEEIRYKTGLIGRAIIDRLNLDVGLKARMEEAFLESNYRE